MLPRFKRRLKIQEKVEIPPNGKWTKLKVYARARHKAQAIVVPGTGKQVGLEKSFGIETPNGAASYSDVFVVHIVFNQAFETIVSKAAPRNVSCSDAGSRASIVRGNFALRARKRKKGDANEQKREQLKAQTKPPL